MRTGRFPLSRILSVTLVGCLFVPAFFGCATGGRIPEGDLPQLVGGPRAGAELASERLMIEIDPGAIDPAGVEHLRVDVSSGDENVTSNIVPAADIPSFELPLRGLTDGESYTFRFTVVMHSGDEVPVQGEITLTLAFGIIAPIPDNRNRNTFDPRPEFSWAAPPESVDFIDIEVDGDGAELLYRAVVPAEGASHRPPAAIVSPEAIIVGVDASWRMRFARASGVVGPWSESGSIAFTREIGPIEAVVGYGSEPTIVSRPAVAWRPVPGAVRYRVELEVAGAGISRTADNTTVPLEPDTLIGLLNEVGRAVTTPVSWRIVAINEFGIEAVPSRWYRFVYRPLVPTMEPIFDARDGESVEVLLGSDRALSGGAAPADDESPQAAIRLPHHFEMARYEATADLAAAVVDRMIRDGRARVEVSESATGGDATVVVDTAHDLPVVGLGELDFGRQFTLELSSERRIVPAQGYRSHPVVGVTWYGAILLANELSLLAGLEAVYTVLPTGEVVADTDNNGYRLPTEAEWAAAVGETVSRNADADGVAMTVVREDRPIRPVELRGTNFERSGDRWEDVAPPYTSAGGPTTPVGALGFATEHGIADLLGNVWEWTGDWYDPRWYRRIADGSAEGNLIENPFPGPVLAVPDVYDRALKVLRGGAWNTPRQEIRPTSRGSFPPDGTSHSIGVRLVRTLPRTPVQAARNN